MTTTPADALPVLLDRACRGVATPAEAEQLRAAVAQLQRQVAAFHDGEEPYEDERIVPTPGQWIWFWNRATPQRRQAIAALVLEQQDRLNHYTWTERIELYKRAEAAEWRAASADRYRAAWQSARRRNRWARSILDGYRADTIASRTKQAACDHRDPKRLGARRDLATVCACGHVLFPPVFGPRPDGQP